MTRDQPSDRISSSPTASTSASRPRCSCSSRSPRPTSCAPTAANACCRCSSPGRSPASTTWSPRWARSFTILFAFSFLPQVVLFVGNMLVSDSALDYVTRPPRHLWKVPVAVALLAFFYAVVGVAVASLTRPAHRGRRVDHRPLPRVVDHLRHPRRRLPQRDDGSAAGADQRARACRSTCATSCSSATSTTESPLNGVANGGLLAVAHRTSRVLPSAIGVLLRRYRWTER